VALIGAALAGVWGISLDDAATVTSSNATRVFQG
jgi:hypothetical protein